MFNYFSHSIGFIRIPTQFKVVKRFIIHCKLYPNNRQQAVVVEDAGSKFEVLQSLVIV